jgi:hypothetical protein
MDPPRCDLGRSDPKDEIDGCMVRVVGQWRKHEKDGESVDEKPCASCGRILEVSERDSDSFRWANGSRLYDGVRHHHHHLAGVVMTHIVIPRESARYFDFDRVVLLPVRARVYKPPFYPSYTFSTPSLYHNQ